MKNFLLVLCITFSFSAMSHAQKAQGTQTFSKEQQAQIKKVLGSDFAAVFSTKGELAIATKTSVSKVKALKGGGFTKNVGGSVANNILIHEGWILATSMEIMQAMQSKLGKERFSQLETLMVKK